MVKSQTSSYFVLSVAFDPTEFSLILEISFQLPRHTRCLLSLWLLLPSLFANSFSLSLPVNSKMPQDSLLPYLIQSHDFKYMTSMYISKLHNPIPNCFTISHNLIDIAEVFEDVFFAGGRREDYEIMSISSTSTCARCVEHSKKGINWLCQMGTRVSSFSTQVSEVWNQILISFSLLLPPTLSIAMYLFKTWTI